TDVEDHVVAIAIELVVAFARLRQHLDVRDPGQLSWNGQEEGGMEDELLFVRDAPPHPAAELLDRQGGGRSRELDGHVEVFEQGEAPDVADEDGASVFDGLDRSVEDAEQILEGREVLNHGVQDDDVAGARRYPPEIVGAARQKPQGSEAKVRPFRDALQARDRLRGEIRRRVSLAPGGEPEEEEAGPASD